MMRTSATSRTVPQPPALPGVVRGGLRIGRVPSCVPTEKPPAEPGAAGVHACNPRRGVTLIELMVTIMIIGILAAAVLGVAAVAGETAREAKTKAIISRIHTLLMQQYDTYINRRVKLRKSVIDAINNLPPSYRASDRGKIKAECRLYALREMMLMEIPDRWSDVVLAPVTSLTVPTLYPYYLDVSTSNGRTELSNLYLRNFRRIAAANNKITGVANTLDEVLKNQGAECLYMVVMNACGDGEARTLFPESNIGDTDGDGAPEFIDGWGHAIDFLLWAPGFESDIQVNANDFGIVADPTQDTAWMSAASGDHDPYDLYRTDLAAFRLVPLVFSSGRDEEYGLREADPKAAIWTGIPDVNVTVNLGNAPKLLPWRYYDNGTDKYYLGTNDGSKTATDDVTNHLISTR